MTQIRLVAVYKLWGIPEMVLVKNLVAKGFPLGIAYDIEREAKRPRYISSRARGWACIDLQDSNVRIKLVEPINGRFDDIVYFHFEDWSQVIARMNLVGLEIHPTLALNK